MHSQATFSISLAKYDTMRKQIFEGLKMSCHLCLSEQALNAEANCSLINMYNAISLRLKCLKKIYAVKLHENALTL